LLYPNYSIKVGFNKEVGHTKNMRERYPDRPPADEDLVEAILASPGEFEAAIYARLIELTGSAEAAQDWMTLPRPEYPFHNHTPAMTMLDHPIKVYVYIRNMNRESEI
jgi:hypothetical protein